LDSVPAFNDVALHRKDSDVHIRTLIAAAACVLLPSVTAAQGLSGALIATVKDAQGGVVQGASVRVSSPALIGGEAALVTNETGQLRFLTLPPGLYVLTIEQQGFATYREDAIPIGAGATIERTAVLKVSGVEESVVVEGAGSRIEARDSGFGTRFGPDDLKTIPTRRSSMFDFVRAAPGISPTSPAGGTTTTTTISAFGSGTNENQFLFDGTNVTCPCNGVARSEPGIEFIQEVQVQSIGASAEFGNVQGAVINVVTRQGGEQFLGDTSVYGQTEGMTSQPVLLPMTARSGESGYTRARYRDINANMGGPVRRDRLWFFAGYQYLRDFDSQPGVDPGSPRTYEQDKMFAKLTWKLTPAMQLVQSVHNQVGSSADPPTHVTPVEAIARAHGSAPSSTFGHLTHTLGANSVWDVRVGRFVFNRDDGLSPEENTTSGRFDRVTGVSSGAPQRVVELKIARTTTKATFTHYRPRTLGADHQLKVGGQFERGEHESRGLIPTGVRYVDANGLPSEAVSSPPSNIGGVADTAAAFASDAITFGNRLTINAGIRFDHSRASHQDLPALDAQGSVTDEIIDGGEVLYTWNLFSPRLGVTARLSADGRTILRASYGRFSQGVLTGELEPFHPGSTAMTTRVFDAATGGYTGAVRVVDPKVNLQLDRETKAPRTDEFSIGVDHELGRRLAVAVAYVRKNGANFIGWTEVGGQYREETRTLSDNTVVPAFALTNAPSARRFRLTNPEGYSLTYNGLVVVAEKRRSHGWQAFGSYTFSRASGLQPSSGATAAGAQVSTVSPPQPIQFGRDPNDLTNARGRLPNDRPHVLRVMGSVDVPRTGLMFAGNFQHFSGKPWAETAIISVPQGELRVLLEPRGTRRLPSQSLLDVRLSRPFSFGNRGRIELLLDVLNLLNDTAAEGLASDNRFSPNFAKPTLFMDPRRVMIGARLSLGR
jgi:hypothetical protein